jgi:putative FmdB family regulatory protein
MPFYEYQCKNCGHALEAMQKISDAPLKKCPDCGKSQLMRLMSAPVFRLKGGGWYETDFKGDQDNKRNLADRPEADASKGAATETKALGGDKGTESKGVEAAGVKEAAPKDTAPKDAAAAKPAQTASTAGTAHKTGGARKSGRGRDASAQRKVKKKTAAKAKMRR